MAQPNALQFDYDSPDGAPVYDGGPNSDSIGPECDIAANTCTTAAPFSCPVNMPTLVPNGPNGHYHAAYAAQTICIGAATADCDDAPTADVDSDGVVNAHDTCIGGANPPQVFAGPSGQDTTTVPANAGDSAIVASGAGFTEGSPIVIGLPGDGKGGRETLRYITALGPGTISFTPPLSYGHLAGTNVAQVAFAQPIVDIDDDGYVDVVGDFSTMAGAAWSQGGDPANDGVGDDAPAGYEGRFDMNNDRFIDVTGDFSRLGGAFGERCGPPS